MPALYVTDFGFMIGYRRGTEKERVGQGTVGRMAGLSRDRGQSSVIIRQGESENIMHGLAEGWAKGRAKVRTGERQDGGQQTRQSGGVTGAGHSGG